MRDLNILWDFLDYLLKFRIPTFEKPVVPKSRFDWNIGDYSKPGSLFVYRTPYYKQFESVDSKYFIVPEKGVEDENKIQGL